MALAILIIIASFLWVYLMWNKGKSNYPPGPVWFPFVGNSPLLKKWSKKLGGQHLAIAHLSKKYKTNVLGLTLGREYCVYVLSYKLIKEVLTSEVYEGRPDNFFIRLRCLGTRKGITMTDESFWKEQRRFVVRHLRNLGYGRQKMETMIKDEAIEILNVIESEQKPMEIWKLIAPSVINILWCLVSGQRIPRSDPKLNEIMQLFHLRTKAFDVAGGILGQFPWLRFVAPELSGFNLIQKLNKELRDLFLGVINDHFEKWSLGNNDDVIFSFIGEMNSTKDSSNFTTEQLIMICLDIFIAGLTTTNSMADFALLMMILYPEIQKDVHKCLDKEFPENHSLTYADIKRVPFIEAVLLEVERYCYIFPIAGVRRVLKDTTLDGYFIPKDTTIYVSKYSVHRDKDFWKDPDVFRPRRFLDENGSIISHVQLMSFGLGKRRCLGELLAKQSIFTFFVEIMRKYTVCLEPGSKILTGVPVPGISLTPEDHKAIFICREKYQK